MSKRRAIKSEIPSAEDKIIEQLKTPPKAATTGKTTKRVTLDIPIELHNKIKAHTKARGQSIKGYLLFLASQDIEG
jgi:hypothetical protein